MAPYTAVVTRIVGSQQTTVEAPCRISEFADSTEFFNRMARQLGSPEPFAIVVNHCPYGLISSAQRKGEYVIATLHRN